MLIEIATRGSYFFELIVQKPDFYNFLLADRLVNKGNCENIQTLNIEL